MYIATVGTSIVEQTETLPEMRTVLAELCRPGDVPEDVVVWEDHRRVVLIVTSDGRRIELDGQSITWRQAPSAPLAADDIDARLRAVFLTRKPRP